MRSRAVRNVLFSMTLGLSMPALAHEGHDHKVMGTVIAIDASHIEVKATDGTIQSLQVTSKTRFKKADAPASRADVKPTDRVVVKFAEEAGKAEAHEVLLAAPPAPTAPPGNGESRQ